MAAGIGFRRTPSWGSAKKMKQICTRSGVFRIFPSLSSQFIMPTLTTSIASSISANELTYIAKVVESSLFRSFEVYSVVTVMYLAMSWMLMLAFPPSGRPRRSRCSTMPAVNA